MTYVLVLVLGVVLGIIAVVVYLNLPAETEWRRDGQRWKRKRHGRWEYSEMLPDVNR